MNQGWGRGLTEAISHRPRLSCNEAWLRQGEHCIVCTVNKRAGRREVGACTRCARRMGVEPGPPHTALHSFPDEDNVAWLYLRVVKLDPNLPSRLRERPVTFERRFSVP